MAQRRIEGLDALLDGFLAGGLPTDHGIRPHLIVTVDADTFTTATRTATTTTTGRAGGGPDAAGRPTTARPATGEHTDRDRDTPTPPPSRPATLHGYGHLDRDLLTRLACDATVTVVLIDGDTTEHRHGRCRGPASTDPPGGDPPGASSGTDPPDQAPPGPDPVDGRHACGCPLTPYRHVLDVGRAERIATARQRLAVLVAQGFRCATPGCADTHLQIHHIIPWLLGGRTDMTNLIGLCTSCHTLLHRGLLRCTADGHGGATFHSADGAPIRDTRRHVMSWFERNLDTHLRRHTHHRLGVPPQDARDTDAA